MAFTSEEDLRVRAYHLWEADGRPDGRDLEFWARAQQSLANGLAGAVQRQTRSRPASAANGTADAKVRRPARRRSRRDA